jgi:uncharacterized membrane protein YoaT (DUF817 family)
MYSRLISSAMAGAMLLDGAFHHVPARVTFWLALPFTGCLALIWFPNAINEYTLGTWSRGGQIDTPTPPPLIAAFGWILLITVSAVLLSTFHRQQPL